MDYLLWQLILRGPELIIIVVTVHNFITMEGFLGTARCGGTRRRRTL